MKRTLPIVAALALAVSAANQVHAQALVYDHRSTVYGDLYSGAADVIQAQGRYARDVAKAAEIWVRAEGAHDEVVYRRTEYRYQTLALDREYHLQKLEDKKGRDEAQLAKRMQEAQRLWAQAQYGSPSWPEALGRPEFAASMDMIESLLRNWSPETSPLGDPYRVALATEVGVVRARIAAHPKVNFPGRVEAMRALGNLELLAEHVRGGSAPAGEKLAMR